ncbi:efflux transporter outer membrane subunit [Oleiagrimonas soli]|uniref:NodT family efflux transporter outer membrane factor (OMF) lipoprotein n=1 Tax=Oleiagrimonas soli TaxID=1543381 RepID=A0A841KFX8_9GAMM|nr:efflux transporter outer membrane subunit [Oleiagrimonas soli]MBB6183925.1 NodT family efflux transporter outer membrane factor (OMF) lipoprotein [Oleiagrimonas soli]
MLARGSLMAAAALATLLAGCVRTPMPKLDQHLPAQWRHAAAASRPPVDLHRWWQAFHDPMLDRLVDEALENNLDVAIARQHLRAERALYGSRNAPVAPNLRARTDDPIDPDAESSYFVVGFDATWELGLFGRTKALDRIATSHVLQARTTLREARVSLVAEVVRETIALRSAQSSERSLERVLQARQRQAALTRRRVALRLSDRMDQTQADAAVATARAALAQPRMQADHAAQRLALLLGRSEPDPAWLKPGPQPRLGPTGPVAAPASLLRTRPGIAHAEANVLEAAGELGIARADLYPRIGFGASLLWSTKIATYRRDPGTNAIGTVGPILDIPLFDWGMRVSHEHAQSHRLQAAALAYRKAVLTGAAEVEDALGDLQQQREREQAEAQAVADWKQTVDAQRVRRRLGLSSDLDTVNAQIQHAEAELSLIAARQDRDLAYVALYKALGGAPPLPARDDRVNTARPERK